MSTESELPNPLCAELKLNCIDERQKGLKKHLVLNINFYVQRKTIKIGSFEVGVKKAQLHLNLDNGEMPLVDRGLKQTLPTEIGLKIIQRIQEGHSKTGITSILGKLAVNPESSANISKENKCQHSEEKTQEFMVKHALVKHGGTAQAPFWTFETKTPDIPIEGGLFEQDLGVVTARNYPCVIKASVNILPKDYWISGSEGIWPKKMHANKIGIGKILINGNLKNRRCLNSVEIRMSEDGQCTLMKS
jgi:hypothetical protein